MLDVILSFSWLVALIWAVLYTIDAFATNWYKDACQSILSRYIIYQGGIEMNPKIAEEINNSKRLSQNFYKTLVFLSLSIFLFGWSRRFFTIVSYGWLFFMFFEFLSGCIILLWFYVDLHHLYNFGRVQFLKMAPASLSGKLIQTYWYSQRLSAVESTTFGILYLIIGVLTYRFFFIGGAFACFVWAINHYRFSMQISGTQSPNNE